MTIEEDMGSRPQEAVPTEQAETAVVADWSEFEDDLSDAISDSIDMDWNGGDGARAVVRWLNENCPRNEPTSTVAWLVEAPGINYLAVRTLGRSEFYWTQDANKALRFFTKDEADQTAMAVRQMQPDLWAFALALGEAWPREHKWIGQQAAVSTASQPGTSEGREPMREALTKIEFILTDPVPSYCANIAKAREFIAHALAQPAQDEGGAS